MTKKKTARNEQTSKGVASKAGLLMNRLAEMRNELLVVRGSLMTLYDILDDCQSDAASALTQAPDRKRKVK